MTILVISKNYYPKAAAAEIQIRRVINALNEYGNNNITLITEGLPDNTEFSNRLEIINISPSSNKFSFFERVMDRLVCNLICLKRNRFIVKGISLAKRLIKERNYDLLLTVSTPFDRIL